MIPTQTLETFPPFGDNATKVQPDNAKYAAGFQPADVYPAENVNWVWGKSSTGITKLNAGVEMMENEINNVLSEAGKTPDQTKNNQLIESIQKLISDAETRAKLAAHPVGSLYWSSVNTDPGTLFGGTWSRIKDKFILAAGDTYTNGDTGGAAEVTLTSQQIPSHNHGLGSHTHTLTPAGSISVTTNPTFTGSSHSHSYTPAGTVSKHSHTLASHTHNFEHKHTTGNQSAHESFSGSASHSHQVYNDTGTTKPLSYYNSQSGGGKSGYRYNVGSNAVYDDNGYIYTDSKTVTISGTCTGNHTHTTNSLTNASGTAITNTGVPSTNISGETRPTFTGTAATLTATQGGSISGGAYSFTGTQGTTSKATGNTGSTGGGTSHENMPPYLVKFCWERTA